MSHEGTGGGVEPVRWGRVFQAPGLGREALFFPPLEEAWSLGPCSRPLCVVNNSEPGSAEIPKEFNRMHRHLGCCTRF